MNLFNAIVLGVVQGLTEFLPVSSSGHLVLLQRVFGIQEPALLFDTMLHAGTLLAVVVVLRRDILAILRRIIQPLTVWLIIATIPAIVAALAFEDSIERAFQSGRFLGFSFLLTSALLIIAELLSRRAALKKNSTTNQHEPTQTIENFTTESTEFHGENSHQKLRVPLCPPWFKKLSIRSKEAGNMNVLDALVIGVLQAVAVIPGVSRSGATISGALSRGLDRDFAARFSFLLSIPTILGALVFQLKDMSVSIVGGVDGSTEIFIAENSGLSGMSPLAVIAGTATAAIVGFFAIRFMLKIVRERSLYGFAIYTAVLGALVIVDQFFAHLVF